MSSTDDDKYGDIADEDLIEALSQPSQTLPTHSRRSRDSTASGDEEDGKSKKKKYRIRVGVKEVSPARILGATQAEGLPDSSPYRIRGPIYRKPRPEPEPVEPLPILPTPQYTGFQTKILQGRDKVIGTKSISEDEAFARELQNLPDDAFSSSPEDAQTSKRTIPIGSSPRPPPHFIHAAPARKLAIVPQAGFRQTTLFGGRAPAEVTPQSKKISNYRVDKPPEPPTQHKLNGDTLNTWIYPTNLGTIRDYQYTIVNNGLFNNLLVALPTGLGKTFIAATVMYNFFRWTKDAQIVFIAPTKPLVAQQVDACFNIVGLPRSTTTMLTGEQAPVLRAEEWQDKRVFFMTPQTLINDLSSGIADPKKIVLLVVDEAHRATGDYAYVKVVQFIRRFNKSFRILALTATPGASVEAVQEVIDNLEISKVEIRTEESIDIQQFVHRRNIDQILLDPSDEIIKVKELFSKALQPHVNKLCAHNAYWKKDPMALTPYGLMQAQKQYFSSAGQRVGQAEKGMVHALFSVLASVAHSIKLLNFHGIGPFFSTIKDFRQGVLDGKGGKYRSLICEHPDFRKMMDMMQLWISKEDFVGHPKLAYLCDTILNHFLDAGEGRLAEGAPPSSTRVIVFSEYRDSAEDITRILNRHGPMIRASVFVGQQDSKRSEGMNQAAQLDTIRKFKNGIYNVIVATSIGEEGLDIGQVDLIVCYDASASPIRMLQRMGRTGRKRAGNIVLLLMRGKEEDNFTKAKDNYEQMQKMIASGARFNFRHDLSARIVPREITPAVEKRVIDIPVENTRDPSLPEPKRRPKKDRKKPAKKFHMPDGVETGFRKASKFTEDDGLALTDFGVTVKAKNFKRLELAPIPDLESVLLSPERTKELARRFQNIPGSELQEVSMPDMTSHPEAQRFLLPTVHVPHGFYTKKCVRLFRTLASSQSLEDRYLKLDSNDPIETSWSPPPLVEDGNDKYQTTAPPKNPPTAKRKLGQKHASAVLADDSDEERNIPRLAKRRQVRKQAITMSAKDMEERSSQLDQTQQPSSEGEGDDLEHSEEISDDSDGGESLVDFVVDGRSSSIARHLPSSRTSTPSSSAALQKQRSSFETSQITTTQDTNDDLPDVEELVSAKTKPISRPLEDFDSDDEGVVADRRGKRRRILEDDSDE